jgi:hypothetical protein
VRVAVFAGPSLPAADRLRLANLTYLPSAARGDVEAAAGEFDAIVLIDGVFLEDLAPSPKEVLAACRDVPLYGASSIGALRAVECAPYGAHPLGVVARWFASGRIDGDDEVALNFDARSGRPLSVPLVNVRYFIRTAVHCNLITAPEAGAIFAAARAAFYADRAWADVLMPIAEPRRTMLQKFAERHGDLKRLDAVTALRSVARRLGLLESPPAFVVEGTSRRHAILGA